MSSMLSDDFGNRMKQYEFQETSRKFLPTLPVYARIDGRGFSKFTKGMRRPYDERMSNAMIEATKYLVKETHAKIGYVQSDEISLVWHEPDYKSSVFFEGKVMKMTSVLAGMATSAFMMAVLESEDVEFRKYAHRRPHFDARAISLPSQMEAANMILWRSNDAFKNAVSMAAHNYFSHNSLQCMNQSTMQERLFQEKGINFNDYPEFFKRGTFVRKETYSRPFTTEELLKIPAKNRPDPSTLVSRNNIVAVPMPIFSKVTNRVGVIFNGESPLVSEIPNANPSMIPQENESMKRMLDYCDRAN
jgi:tRNA(His) guanylyltransferase